MSARYLHLYIIIIIFCEHNLARMLFQTIIMTALNPNRSLHQAETDIANLGRLTSDILQASDRGRDPNNGTWNDPTGQAVLSAFTQRWR